MNNPSLKLYLIVLVCLVSGSAFAGGPLVIGGPAVGARPAFGIDGRPFTWNPAKMPIQYRLDPGPMAATVGGTVVIDNVQGAQRVQSMFNVWQSVPTASVSFSNVGAILPAGAYTGGDLKTIQQYNDVLGSCNAGAQSPVIFDADSSLMSALGVPTGRIRFTNGCALDSTNGFLTSALIVLNGRFQDGLDNTDALGRNFELSANEFDEAITHEMGHFLGLDHSQINVDLMNSLAFPCDISELAGLPLMFPFELCQARKDAGLPTLAPDDQAWISKLYPSATQVSSYGTISGSIIFSDGVSGFQGANVIARVVDDPNTPEDESRRVAVSVVSGFLFTGNPGQSITANMPDPRQNNIGGSPNGSRNTQLIGFYEIPVPPGTYTVEVESISPTFVGGSGVGPLASQVSVGSTPEFWNQNESAFDSPLQRDAITVHAGENITDVDIILNGTNSQFDQFEDTGSVIALPLNEVLGQETGRLA